MKKFEQAFISALSDNKYDSFSKHVNVLLRGEGNESKHPFSFIISTFSFMMCQCLRGEGKEKEWSELCVQDYFLFREAMKNVLMERFAGQKLKEEDCKEAIERAIFESGGLYEAYLRSFEDMVSFQK